MTRPSPSTDPSVAAGAATGSASTTEPGRALALPDTSCLLHIGVPKTGTTALQEALAAARPELRSHGVVYPGSLAHHSRAALAVLGTVWGWREGGGRPVKPMWWPDLLAEVTSAPGEKVAVSSEFFCEADDALTARVVDSLGRERVHVVVTLRPLTKILPSAWQQYLKAGQQRTYQGWLQAVLADPPKREVTPSFWKRHDHGRLVERWANEVGADRVTVVIVDETRPRLILDTFEQLLGLPDGLLAPTPSARSNRSLTAAECEVVRRVNTVVRKADVTWPQYSDAVKDGLILRMVEAREPDPGEARILTPAWAVERSSALGAQAAARIAASGVRVVGDLASLSGPTSRTGEPEPVTEVPVEATVEALLGLLSASLQRGAYFGDRPVEGVDQRPVNQVTARDLVKVLGRRAVVGARRRLHRTPARPPVTPSQPTAPRA